MVRAQLKKTFETGDAQEFSYRLIATDGNVHEFKATVNSFSHAGIPRAVVISIDISELRRTEKILDIYSHAFENMAEGMILTSADGYVVDKDHGSYRLEKMPSAIQTNYTASRQNSTPTCMMLLTRTVTELNTEPAK